MVPFLFEELNYLIVGIQLLDQKAKALTTKSQHFPLKRESMPTKADNGEADKLHCYT